MAGPGTCAVASSAGTGTGIFIPPVCASRLLRMRGRENGRSAPSGPAAALPGLEETSGRARLLCGLPVDFGPLGRARARLMGKGTGRGWPWFNRRLTKKKNRRLTTQLADRQSHRDDIIYILGKLESSVILFLLLTYVYLL